MRKYKIKLVAKPAVLEGHLTIEAIDEEEAKELALSQVYDVKFQQIYDINCVNIVSVQDVGPAKSNRKMASIQRVVDIAPIEGADSIEVARVLGWQCVVKKGVLKKDDLCVYFEIDSLLPKREEFQFMESRHYRVKTIKLKGQISQGLALPISDITYADLSSYKEDDDVTDVLGVYKYEAELPAELRGKVAGKFPGFLQKTDEERIQSCPKLLTYNTGRTVYATEKLDGSSFTAYLKTDLNAENYNPESPTMKFGLCSRNLELKPDNDYFAGGDIKNTFWKVAKQEQVEEKLRKYGKNVAVQGEMVGPGIQKNKYYLKDFGLYLFNIYNIDTGTYFNLKEMQDFCAELSFKMVPIVDVFVLDHTVDDLVKMSAGNSVLCPKSKREGLVIRNIDGERFSFKVINPYFLLKHSE